MTRREMNIPLLRKAVEWVEEQDALANTAADVRRIAEGIAGQRL